MGNDKGAPQLSSFRRWSASASPFAIGRCPQGQLPRGPPPYIHQSGIVAKKDPPLVQIFGTPSKCQTQMCPLAWPTLDWDLTTSFRACRTGPFAPNRADPAHTFRTG